VELFDEYDPISINEIVNTKPYFAIKESNDDDAEVAVDSSQITDAYATTSSGSVVLVMTFTTDGQSAIANLTSSGSGTLYFYFGSEYRGMTYSETINQSYLGITLSGSTLATGEYFASEILSSKYDYSFEETRVVTYSKDDATRNCIVAIALTVALFALCVAILTITFKKLGLVGSLVMFISLLAQIVLLQAVPIFVLTGPSLFASLLCMIVGAIAIYLMLSKMHAEYKLGKILYASVKFGYNKIWLNILDMFLIMLFPSIIAYFFGSYLVKQFAMALICGLCVYAFCSLLFTKLFTKWFTNISFKNKDYGFKREEHINELK
jgi:preprotein translocase subunit SecD